ncbi:hypothetical protein [Neobacillus rhizosphaerae]
MIKRGELRTFKVGNRMRIEQSEVDLFKKNMTVHIKGSRKQ